MAIQFHDRWDTTIPVLGGKSAQGWYYTPLETIMTAWLTAGVDAAARNETAAVIERVPTQVCGNFDISFWNISHGHSSALYHPMPVCTDIVCYTECPGAWDAYCGFCVQCCFQKWDGGDQFLECFAYRMEAPEMGGQVGTRLRQTHLLNSAGTRRVMKCLFDGYHGSWLPGDDGEELTWWFMRQHLDLLGK